MPCCRGDAVRRKTEQINARGQNKKRGKDGDLFQFLRCTRRLRCFDVDIPVWSAINATAHSIILFGHHNFLTCLRPVWNYYIRGQSEEKSRLHVALCVPCRRCNCLFWRLNKKIPDNFAGDFQLLSTKTGVFSNTGPVAMYVRVVW